MPSPTEARIAPDDEPHRLLADEADADGSVVADPLERSAQRAQPEVEAARRDAGGSRPSLVRDADGVCDRLPRNDRDDRRQHGEDCQRPGPALERRSSSSPLPR